MAFTDLFRTRRSDRINRQAWAVVWERVKTPPGDDGAAKERHAVFVGTLLYATRYHAVLVAGMDATTARSAALQEVVGAGYDEPMRDRIFTLFSVPPDDPSAAYAAALNPRIAALVERASTVKGPPRGEPVEDLLREIQGLMPLLAERPPNEEG